MNGQFFIYPSNAQVACWKCVVFRLPLLKRIQTIWLRQQFVTKPATPSPSDFHFVYPEQHINLFCIVTIPEAWNRVNLKNEKLIQLWTFLVFVNPESNFSRARKLGMSVILSKFSLQEFFETLCLWKRFPTSLISSLKVNFLFIAFLWQSCAANFVIAF